MCLGRPHLADRGLVARKSVRAANRKSNAASVACGALNPCWLMPRVGEPLECAVNPRLGRESETAEPLKNGSGRVVAIIGAGPAGLSAAEILGLRGFKPIVLEKNAFVGGQLQLANKPPKKEKINWCFTDLYNAAVKNGAEIRFNTEAHTGIDQGS